MNFILSKIEADEILRKKNRFKAREDLAYPLIQTHLTESTAFLGVRFFCATM